VPTLTNIIITLIIATMLASASAAADDTAPDAESYEVFESDLPVAARYPFPHVDGKIYHSTSKRYSTRLRPIKRCVMIHGHGITQGFIDFFIHRKGFGANLSRLFLTVQGLRPVIAFGQSYFGDAEFFESLHRDVCEEIVVTIQESTQSTLWEMTERSERFLSTEVCKNVENKPGQKACAIIGHSKGGGVASLIALRCQESIAYSEEACRNFDEIYSSAGVIGGIDLSVLLLGMKETNEEKRADPFFQKLFGFGRVAPQWSTARVSDLNKMTGTYFDLFSDVITDRTNPAWYDLSPLLLLDHGIPAGLRFAGKDAKPSGWFDGQYAASASSFDFSRGSRIGHGTPVRVYTKGLQAIEMIGRNSDVDAIKAIGEFAGVARAMKERPNLRRMIAEDVSVIFSETVSLIHTEDLQPLFERGRREMIDLARDHGDSELVDIVNRSSWERFQYSDGIVDAHAAISFCQRTYDDLKERDRRCKVYHGQDEDESLNHYAIAGYASETHEHMRAELIQ
jgi:hypothetical protein